MCQPTSFAIVTLPISLATTPSLTWPTANHSFAPLLQKVPICHFRCCWNDGIHGKTRTLPIHLNWPPDPNQCRWFLLLCHSKLFIIVLNCHKIHHVGSIIGEHLRMWMVRKTCCLLLLVVLFLTGLGHGDSHLVTPSFGSLILFSLVFKFFFFLALSFSSLYFLISLCSFA